MIHLIRDTVKETSCLEKLTAFQLPSRIAEGSQIAASVLKSFDRCRNFFTIISSYQPTMKDLCWEVVETSGPISMVKWISDFANAAASVCEVLEVDDSNDYRRLIYHEVQSRNRLCPVVLNVFEIYHLGSAAPTSLVDELVALVLLNEKNHRCKALQFWNLCVMIESTRCSVSLRSAEVLLEAVLDSWSSLSVRAKEIPQMISSILSASDRTDNNARKFKEAFFVDFIVGALSTSKKCQAAAVLYYYTYEIDLLCTVVLQNKLFSKLVEFVHDNPYDSFHLDLVYCHLICMELRQESEADTDEQDDRDLNIKRMFHPGKDVRNCAVHRCLQQITLLVIAHWGRVIDDVQIGGNASAQEVIALRAYLAKFLALINDTVALHSIVFHMRDEDWTTDSGPGLADLLQRVAENVYDCADVAEESGGVERTNCKRYFHADLIESAMRFVYGSDEGDGLITDAAIEVMSVRCAEVNDERNSLIGIHSCFSLAAPIKKAMSFVNKSSDDHFVWHSFFYAVFDHYGKLLPEQNKPLDETMKREFQEWEDSVDCLANSVGDKAVYTSGSNFIRVVLKMLVQQVRTMSNDVVMEKVFSTLTTRTKRLCDTLCMLLTPRDPRKFYAQRVDFDEVVKDGDINAIKGIMENDHIDEPLHSDRSRKLDNFIVQDIIEKHVHSLGTKVKLFGCCLTGVKPRLMIASEGNKASIAALQAVADQKELRRFYKIVKDVDADGFVEDVLWAMCQSAITKLLASKGKTGAEAVQHLMRSLDDNVERQIAHYRYSLNTVFASMLKLNSSLRWALWCDLEEFQRKLGKTYDSVLTSNVVENVDKFQNNQLVALFLMFSEKRLVPFVSPITPVPDFSVLKIATGQGKTLIEVCAALLHLEQQKGSKVFIFTAFPHLAVRDRASMAELVQGRGFSSCVLRKGQADNAAAAVTSDIIYCDSQDFQNIVRRQAIKYENRAFLQLIHGDWSNHLVILDEIDVLMAKDEERYVYDMYGVFKAAYGGRDLKVEDLKSGVLSSVNRKFPNVNTILDSVREQETAAGFDQANASHVHVAGLARQLSGEVGERTIKIQSTCFSLKWKISSARRIIGFSGTVCAAGLDPSIKYMGLCTTPGVYIEVPLFFSPDKRFGDVSCVRCHGDQSSQLSWLHAASSKDKIVPSGINVQRACDTEEEWLSLIEQDVNSALERGQSVLIFAREPDNKVICKVPDQIQVISARLGIPPEAIYRSKEKDVSDSRLQNIVTSKCTSICTKIVGRGADIRVPLDMTEGLHVILVAADYQEEILQQIGRTGRMNRKGSFSIIFMNDDVVPSYPKDDQADSFSGNVRMLHQLSCLFYASNSMWSLEQRTKFVWYQHLLYMKEGKTLEKAMEDLRSLGIVLS